MTSKSESTAWIGWIKKIDWIPTLTILALALLLLYQFKRKMQVMDENHTLYAKVREMQRDKSDQERCIARLEHEKRILKDEKEIEVRKLNMLHSKEVARIQDFHDQKISSLRSDLSKALEENRTLQKRLSAPDYDDSEIQKLNQIHSEELARLQDSYNKMNSQRLQRIANLCSELNEVQEENRAMRKRLSAPDYENTRNYFYNLGYNDCEEHRNYRNFLPPQKSSRLEPSSEMESRKLPQLTSKTDKTYRHYQFDVDYAKASVRNGNVKTVKIDKDEF